MAERQLVPQRGKLAGAMGRIRPRRRQAQGPIRIRAGQRERLRCNRQTAVKTPHGFIQHLLPDRRQIIPGALIHQ